ncbi:quinon protein alcohol dehydrogenase-like superfamily [Cristinia sonorae]|uniref:Quinon protein alcohol dehydrogenase-like superfamily n=1 Tax=Cristinia sonorae TaxID=1940300 RepID=A0A8K0UWY4_9AGAR|nr:quinon protein alcohol dehydrogenase-like superfamily [Cristinia sonorae]
MAPLFRGDPTPVVYAEQLSTRGHGYPMWDPCPCTETVDDPLVFDVTIGDVGYLKEGAFKRLFNVCQPADALINRYGVYDSFEPLEFSARLADRKKNFFDPGFIMSKSLKSMQVGLEAGGGIQVAGGKAAYTFENQSDQGAMLIISHHAHKESVTPNKRFTSFMLENFDRWRGYASQLGLGKETEIIFVRGFIKTKQWTNITWSDRSMSHGIHVEAEGGNLAAAGPPDVKEKDLKDDQCIFLNYYKLRTRPFWFSKLEAHAGYDTLPDQDRDPDAEDRGMEVVHGDQEHRRMYDDPVDIVLDYIFRHSDAEVAIACDGDLQDLLGDDWPEDIREYLNNQLPRIDVDENKTGTLSLEESIMRRHARVEAAIEQAAADAEAAAAEAAAAQAEEDAIAQAVAATAGGAQEGGAGPAEPAHGGDPGEGGGDGAAPGDAGDNPDMLGRDVGTSNTGPKVIPDNLRGAIISLGKDETAARSIDWPHNLLYDTRADAGAVCCLAMNRAGTLVAAGFEDNIVRIWAIGANVITQRLIAHTDMVWGVAFSPTQNKLVSGSGDKSVIIWDLGTGQPIHTIAHGGDVWSVAYAPDGKTVASGAVDGIVRIWDVETGSLVRQLEGHESVIMYIAYSPSGHRLLTAADSIGRLWNPVSGEMVGTIGGTNGIMWSMAFSEGGDRILTGSEDHTGRVWDSENGEELVTLHEHTGPVWAVAWSPDGQKVATGSFDKTIVVSSSYSGERHLLLRDRPAVVNALSWSRDEDFLASGAADGSVKLYDGRSGEFIAEMLGHKDKIKSLIFTPDGNDVVSSSDDGTIRVWNTTDILRLVD